MHDVHTYTHYFFLLQIKAIATLPRLFFILQSTSTHLTVCAMLCLWNVFL
jgi:hypothetical protein